MHPLIWIYGKNKCDIGLAALAQTTRLETFRLLVRHEPEGIPAGELARMLDVPQNTMSAHLATLSRAGLLKSERQSDRLSIALISTAFVNSCCSCLRTVAAAPPNFVSL